jgi:hypothetical protein
VAGAQKRGARRRKRERKPRPGMMLHQDGSRHTSLAGQPPIVTVDDATSEIYAASLVEEEGTMSTLDACREMFGARGPRRRSCMDSAPSESLAAPSSTPAAAGTPTRLRHIQVDFASPVYPGETIRTEIWRDDDAISFRARCLERDIVILNNGLAKTTF